MSRIGCRISKGDEACMDEHKHVNLSSVQMATTNFQESAINLFAALMYSVNRPMVLTIQSIDRAREFLSVVVLM